MNTPWMCFAAGRRRGGGGRGVCQSVSQVHRGPPRRSPLHHTRTPSQRAAPLPWSKHRVLSILAHSEHRGDLLAPVSIVKPCSHDTNVFATIPHLTSTVHLVRNVEYSNAAESEPAATVSTVELMLDLKVLT